MPSDRVPVRDDCEYDDLPAQTGAVEKDDIVQLSREGGGRHILHIHAVLRQNVARLVFWSVAASFESSHCRNPFSSSAELSCLRTLAPRTWDSAPPRPRPPALGTAPRPRPVLGTAPRLAPPRPRLRRPVALHLGAASAAFWIIHALVPSPDNFLAGKHCLNRHVRGKSDTLFET